MGEIIPIVSRAQAESAWDEYRALAVRVVDEPALLADRKHCDALRRAERRWKEIANRLDGAA